MYVFKCKMCGAALNIEQHKSITECEYCGVSQTLPKLEDEVIANLYDRANHFRRNNEFDKAEAIYEQILDKDTTDSEAYWSLVLCRYGIEYVEDSASHKRVPTINRMQYTSIYDDDNYKLALQYADEEQKPIYEDEAKIINEIQKNILDISNKEEPFDVFISYKESDENGNRTVDSTLGYDIYEALTKEGLKVFFSRVTLEDKIGEAYEPYIFAALNSARVMVVLGTKKEYFNSVWMKNEWSRYLSIVKKARGSKVLIPAYKDMDPYDLPEEFSHLQAQDMSKIGFMQDLIRGIKKIIVSGADAKAEAHNRGSSQNTENLLKRANMFLSDGKWEEAEAYYNRILDVDAEMAEAYIGLLLAKRKCRVIKELWEKCSPLTDDPEFEKIQQFSKDEALKKELKEINDYLEIYYIYCRAIACMNKTSVERNGYREAIELFEKISGFEDADKKAEECRRMAPVADSYSQGIGLMVMSKLEDTPDKKAALKSLGVNKSGEAAILEKAIQKLSQAKGYLDADKQLAICKADLKSIKDAANFRKGGLIVSIANLPLSALIVFLTCKVMGFSIDINANSSFWVWAFGAITFLLVGINVIINIVHLVKFIIYNIQDKTDACGDIEMLSFRMIFLFVCSIILIVVWIVIWILLKKNCVG